MLNLLAIITHLFFKKLSNFSTVNVYVNGYGIFRAFGPVGKVKINSIFNPHFKNNQTICV